MTSINWHDVRPWEGTQQKGFEEVCAQLAASEPAAAGANFVRKGATDAGVECYWRLPTGEERGWQAKLFHALGENQWRQLDDSVQTALAKHPRLMEYIVCIPLDLADPRLTDNRSAHDRWEEHVQKWENWARDAGSDITFTYWGAHELGMRLMRDEHRGRVLYWFNKQLFSAQWFADRLEETIANADQRYLPELNVDLPIQQVFDGLARNAAFYDDIKTYWGKIRSAHEHLRDQDLRTLTPTETNALQQHVRQLATKLEGLDVRGVQPLPWPQMKADAEAIGTAAHDLRRALWRTQEQRSAAGERHPERSYDSTAYDLSRLEQAAGALAFITDTHAALLANKPALLLVGNAGAGKTHLLCHVARSRQVFDLPTVLVLSEQLGNGEPWAEVLRVLHLSCDADEFLGALSAAAQVRRSRVFLAIDALNEGDARAMWVRQLPGFLRRIARYPWVGVVLSIRQSYEELAAKSVAANDLIRLQHRGFQGIESRAAVHFLAQHGIIAPTIPPLHPEFSNPLFLRMFCQAIKTMGYQQIPPGLHGFTSVFTFFLDAVNTKLSGPAFLDVDPSMRVVYRCVDRLTNAMARQQRRWLPYDEAKAIVDACSSSPSFERSVSRQLILEGVIAKDQFSGPDGDRVDGIRFTYEKFSDHLIATHLLNEHLQPDKHLESFAPGTVLGAIFSDERSAWEHRGLLEALAIQLPERTGKELFDLVPQSREWWHVREAVIESIIWRHPSACTAALMPYVNRYLLEPEDTKFTTMAALLTVAMQVDHPLNARFLHRNLFKIPMPDRDAWWSTFLYDYYGDQTPNVITRILDWCEIDTGKQDLLDEALLLVGITLAWLLTCSDRFLRDRASKALVRVFAPRVRLFAPLLQEFSTVDDPYVLERMVGAAYGCVMRSDDVNGIRAVAQVCYGRFFEVTSPVHILLRDYARGVVERALHLDATAPFDRVRLLPPYGSLWPDKLPTLNELKALGDDETSPETSPVSRSQREIYFSVIAGDFSSYVIGTNIGSFEWRNIPLGGEVPRSFRELSEEFVASLSARQRKLWGHYVRAYEHERRHLSVLIPQILIAGREKAFGRPVRARRGRPRKDRVTPAREALYETLSATQRVGFDQGALPFLQHGNRRFDDEDRFDLSLLQRYILPRVFTLGWTAERFDEFDQHVRITGRESHKPERLGKKYQWIAYHEALARVADNFVFTGNNWGHDPVPFGGAWQLTGLRDLDPSVVIDGTQQASGTSCWWAPPSYQDWQASVSDEVWMRHVDDMVPLSGFLRVTDPTDGSRWLNLEAGYHWTEPTPPERERRERPYRDVSSWLQAFIVRKEDLDEVLVWGQAQNFWNQRMPETCKLGELFLGELFWSPAYFDLVADQRGNSAWTRGWSRNDLPKSVIVPVAEYLGESQGYDCSLKDTLSFFVPSAWLGETLGLHWRGVEGEFVSADGTVVARDPSVRGGGPRALLVRESILQEVLDSAGLALFWKVQGMKWVLNHHPPLRQELQINGAFGLRGGIVVGSATPRYRDYEREPLQ